jgi:hypothetical protein
VPSIWIDDETKEILDKIKQQIKDKGIIGSPTLSDAIRKLYKERDKNEKTK